MGEQEPHFEIKVVHLTMYVGQNSHMCCCLYASLRILLVLEESKNETQAAHYNVLRDETFRRTNHTKELNYNRNNTIKKNYTLIQSGETQQNKERTTIMVMMMMKKDEETSANQQ